MEAQLEEKNQELQRVRVQAQGRAPSPVRGNALRQGKATPRDSTCPDADTGPFSILSCVFRLWPHVRVVC